MNHNNKKIFYYIIIFILFYVFSKAGHIVSKRIKVNEDLLIIFAGLIFTSIIYLLKCMLDVKDNFHFEVTPEKLCDGGPYMYSSNPEIKKLCDSFSNQDLAKYSCCPGFHGRPVWWERTNDTDADWNNPICKGNFKNYDDPKVL